MARKVYKKKRTAKKARRRGCVTRKVKGGYSNYCMKRRRRRSWP